MTAAASTGRTGAPRTAGRRPALPNGRAVLGGLLVAAAAVGTFAAWSGADDPPSARYVVAARDLPVGEVLDDGDLDLVALDVPARLAERALRATPALVVGQRTVAPLAEGELVQRSAVVVPEDAGDGAPDEPSPSTWPTPWPARSRRASASTCSSPTAAAPSDSITEVVAARRNGRRACRRRRRRAG